MTALDALADPVRRRLCECLAQGDAPAGALALRIGEEFGISQPATSRHLRILREAGVVSVRAEGTTRWYALHREPLEAATAWLRGLAPTPSPALDALATEVARGRRVRRTGVTTRTTTRTKKETA